MRKIKLLIACVCVLFVSCSSAENKNINASDIIKMIQKGKPVQIADKVVFGDLNFADALEPEFYAGLSMQTKIEHSVSFVGCVFMGNVSAKSVRDGVSVQTFFGTNLFFQNCDFRGEVNFDEAEIHGFMSFHNSTFRKKASFNNINVWSSDCVLSYIKAEDKFDMISSRVKGTLNVSNSEFAGQLKLQALSVDDNFIFNAAKCAANVDMSLLRIGNRAMFNYAEFAGNCNLLMSRIGGDAEFTSTKFAQSPNLENAVFYGRMINANNLDLSKSILIIKQ